MFQGKCRQYLLLFIFIKTFSLYQYTATVLGLDMLLRTWQEAFIMDLSQATDVSSM